MTSPLLSASSHHQREEGRDAQPSALALICGGTMDGLRAHCEYSLKVHGCNMGAAAAIGSCRTAWAVVRFGPRQQISRTKVLHAQSIASPSILKPDGVGSNTSPLWCPINLFGSYGAFPYSWHICICLGKRAQGQACLPRLMQGRWRGCHLEAGLHNRKARASGPSNSCAQG